MGRAERQLFVYRLKPAWRRFDLRARLRPARLLPAIGIGVIVGGGMAAYAWVLDQPPLLFGLGSGVGTFLVVFAF